MKTLLLQASSRSGGNTHQIVTLLQEHLQADLIDLWGKNIGPYDYEHRNSGDDFLPTMRRVVEYDRIIFVTPVYWYSMSATLKLFFDRLTDCLKVEKDLGRRLRGKTMAAVACGSDDVVTEGFFVPFRNTAGYLGMTYAGNLHTWVVEGEEVPEEVKLRVEKFCFNYHAFR
ncbi:MAG: NAD(P)H-dependent oxidoreductase [Saprospiraceae bacterium]